MFVLDSHCDTPSQILRLRNMNADDPHSQVDFPKLKRGGVDGAFFALYIPSALGSAEACGYAFRLLSEVNRVVSENHRAASFALSPAQAYACQREGKFAVCLGLENASPIGKSIPLLHQFYKSGVRYVTLCHSRDNYVCDSCSGTGTWGGLSTFGKEVVAHMNRIGMIVDLSHASDKTFYDVISCSKAPVAATHSCCRALASHRRNLDDDMLRALKSNGGVVQINFFPVFLDDGFASALEESGLYEKADKVEEAFIADPADNLKREAWYEVLDELERLRRPSFRRIADHIDHAVEVAGIDSVGLGSDFDGICVTPEGMENAGCFSAVFDELRSRGYDEEAVSKIAGGNFFRVWEKVRGEAEILPF